MLLADTYLAKSMAAMAEDYVPLREPPIHDPGDPRWRRSKSVLRYILLAMIWAFIIRYIQVCFDERNVARFSVNLDAFGGMNTTTVAAGRTVSPWFILTVKAENTRAWQSWCCAGGELVVSYDGVSLAWERVPGFCMPRKGTVELTVAAAGKGVGLSDDSRRRFAAEWNTGTAQVVAEMKLFYNGNGWRGTYGYKGVSLVSRKLALLRGQDDQEAPHAH